MIANKFHAKLNLKAGLASPEVYDSGGHSRPNDDFVISRHRDDTIAARYGDMKWDISAWETEGRLTTLYFNFWRKAPVTPSRDLLGRDAKWLMFALIWLRDGAPFGNGTLMNYMFTIRALALYADNHLCSIPAILSSESNLIDFSENHCSAGQRKTLCGLLSHLERIGERLIGFSVIGESMRLRLRERVRRLTADVKQTPPIPTRIYSQILISLSKELTDWETVATECLEILGKCSADPLYGRRTKAQQSTQKTHDLDGKLRPNWANVTSPNVRTYLCGKGQSNDISGLTSMVTQVQLVAKLTIQAFSGMRDDEALTLPFGCLEESECGGRVQRFVRGRSTKLSKEPRNVRWVTNKEGHRAIRIAQKIATAIYSACSTSKRFLKSTTTAAEGCPLFISTAYWATGGRRRRQPDDGHFFAGCLALARFHRMRSRLQPSISTEDLLELEQIDEHRAWRTEDSFQVGGPWCLETHQLRRSLAIYAQRSGLVTLPSLRRQLQHITDEMARYYARGSHYARDVFGEASPKPGHFCFEWQATQVESSALSYASHVLFTDDKLFGGHAAFVLHRLKGEAGIVSAEIRSETIRMFNRGQLHYRETILGGCTKQDECESPALDWLNLECIASNCRNMVGSLTKLESIVREQELFVRSLPSTSVLYRTENTNLQVLVRARDKVLQAQNSPRNE